MTETKAIIVFCKSSYYLLPLPIVGTRSSVFLPQNHCTSSSIHLTDVLLFHGNYFSCTPFPLLFPKNSTGLDATLFNTRLLPPNTEVVCLSHLFQKPISHHPFHPILHCFMVLQVLYNFLLQFIIYYISYIWISFFPVHSSTR